MTQISVCRTCGKIFLYEMRRGNHIRLYCGDKCENKVRGARGTRRNYGAPRKAAIREWVRTLKAAPCTDCGQTFPPECMDFDHRDGRTKLRGVGILAGAGSSRRLISTEIAKCDLVCANCHRIRTQRRFNARRAVAA